VDHSTSTRTSRAAHPSRSRSTRALSLDGHEERHVDKRPKTRAGFVATAKIERHAFGVSWNASLDRGGVAWAKATFGRG